MELKQRPVAMLLVAALLSVSTLSNAQTEAGFYSSPKGYGLTVCTPTGGDDMNSYTLYADISGFLLESESIAGVKFNYTRIIPLKKKSIEGTVFSLYAGTGASTGWVHDNGSSGKCAILALSGALGLNVGFARNLAIDLSIRPELGIKIERDNVLSNNIVSFYRYGAIQSLVPQVAILYTLGRKPVFTKGRTKEAKDPAFRFGVEWGLTSTFYNYHHYNYYDEHDGYRVNDKGGNFKYTTNGYIEAYAGLDFARIFNASARLGVAGVEKGVNVIPAKLRLTAMPAGCRNDGVLFFIEAGHGFDIKEEKKACLLGSLGSGYRVALTRNMSIDFSTALRVVLDHPQITDTDSGEYVSSRNIRRDNAIYCGLDYSISLNF